MKIGILSDAHGNPEGVRGCLECLTKLQVDQLYFLGDAFGYFPDVAEVLGQLKSTGVHCLMGNHEAMFLKILEAEAQKEDIYRIHRFAPVAAMELREEISSFLPYLSLEIGKKKILLVHGSPWDPLNGRVYPDADLSSFSRLPYDAVFMAHTHLPFIRHVGSITVSNVGSCGLPRDQGSLLSCAVYDSEANRTSIFRIAMDVKAIKERYERRVHRQVIECLSRQSQSEIVGQIVQ